MSDQEKKLLIKRTESSVEITVGSEADSEENDPKEPFNEQTKEMEPPETDKNSNTIFCCRPLTKLQLYWLALIAIVVIILSLLVIVILLGIVASHGHRLRLLESEAQILVASNAELRALVHGQINNSSKFQARVSPLIDDFSSQLSIVYLHTMKLYSVGKEHENRLDLLTNETESLKTHLERANTGTADLVSRVKNLEEAQNATVGVSSENLQPKTFLVNVEEKIHEQDDENCHKVILCVNSQEGHRVCTHGMSSDTFHRVQMLFHGSTLNLEYQCID